MKLLFTALAIITSQIFAAEKTLNLEENFNGVRLEGSAKLIIHPAAVTRLVIESENSSVFDYIKPTMDKSTLVLDVTDKNKNVGKLFSKVTMHLYYDTNKVDLSIVELSGKGRVSTKGVIKSDIVFAECSGTGKLDIQIEANKFTAMFHGAGTYRAHGKATVTDIKLDGTCGYNGLDLVSTKTYVEVNGAGGAKVNVTETLVATLIGVGSIKYKGNPTNIDKELKGVGSIKEYVEKADK